MKKTKKRVLKKWCESLLIFVNCLIFCFLACINDFQNIKTLILISLVLITIFYINYKILIKYSKTLKEL